MTSALPRNDATTRDARRAWTIGGALLIVSTLVGTIAAPMLWTIPGSGFAGPALFSIALLIFAFGIRRAGSVTARRPLGTGALAVLALWTFASRFVWDFIPDESLALDQQVVLGTVGTLMAAILAAVAAVQVARAGVVPSPWNWAPFWALIAVIVPSLLQLLIFAVGSSSSSQAAVTVLVGLDQLVRSTAVVFLGVLAIVLATRPASTRTVSIIAPRR
ncbi:hypothetical protein [Agromyces neolithicus]|uniref:hypothetical protein n=1 Tax=Agromyces neolithicus TaxID=269420 RepID=UPI0031DA8A34